MYNSKNLTKTWKSQNYVIREEVWEMCYTSFSRKAHLFWPLLYILLHFSNLKEEVYFRLEQECNYFPQLLMLFKQIGNLLQFS